MNGRSVSVGMDTPAKHSCLFSLIQKCLHLKRATDSTFPRAKISQFIASLSTSLQQVLFALVVQVVNKFETTFNKLDGNI